MPISGNYLVTLVSVVALTVHALGVVNAAHAVMTVRSARGAVAWSISLITFPWLTIPLYWILGRNQFHGYTELLQQAYIEHHELVHQAFREIADYRGCPNDGLASLQKIANTFSEIGFISGNTVELLVDGQQTFAALLEAIAAARHYILFQFYIINDDALGKRFRDALIEKANQGVRVYVLYDEIGSKKMTRSYVRSLQDHGIQVSAFNTTRGKGNHFQLNFRNHRKIVVIDGEIGFTGGLNIGDEYLGRDPQLSPWRDTHMQIQGPAVKLLQATFLSDWYWATRKFPVVNWQVAPHTSTPHTLVDCNATEWVYILDTSSANPLPVCTLFFTHLINQACDRLWIASPYFVPDEAILTALKLASSRGVDVRIILPNRPDHLLVYMASFSYYTEMQRAGVKLYRYQPGFMHQKVILVDRLVAGVGTVNLDNRSFFLNFEVMGFVASSRFIDSVEQMLLDDLSHSRKVDDSEYKDRSFGFRLAVQVSRLSSPVL